MNKGHCAGLIGGLGVGAVAHYYKRLAEAHQTRGISMDLVMAHAESSCVFEFIQANDREGLAVYLNSFILRLESAGAAFAVIPAVAPHFCMRELVAISPIPLLSIFEPLLQELALRSIRKAALFGTNFVMESKLFGMAPDVEFIRPRPEEVDYIQRTYLELVQRGRGSEEQYNELTNLAQILCKRDQADAIILAGTDLALLFNDANVEFPHIDCAALHIRAIAGAMLGDSSLSSR